MKSLFLRNNAILDLYLKLVRRVYINYKNYWIYFIRINSFVVLYASRLVLLFSAYFFTATLGLQLDAVSGFAALVWPPTGIALAALLLYGYTLSPAVLVGALVVNLVAGAPFFVALGIAIGNTLEALVGVFLLKNVVSFNKSLERLKDVLWLIFFAAVFSTAISATIGVTSLFLGGIVDLVSLHHTWIVWWMGDILGSLVIAPLILLWSIKSKVSFKPYQVVEGFILGIFLITLSFIVFHNFLGINNQQLPITYVIFIPLMWISLRFGQRESVTAVFLTSLIAISGIIDGRGVFATEQLSLSLMLLQGFISVIAVTFLILSAVLAERRQVESRKDEFIGVASHELKTPITTIAAYIQLFERYLRKTKNKRMLGYTVRINEQVDKLIKLISDLLDVTKINSNKLAINSEQFSIGGLVREIVKDLQLTSNQRIILKGAIDKNIFADRYRIGQVLINLVTNAVKFSPKSKKVIVEMKSNNKYVMISVKDYGIGISKQDQKKIFGRFFQTKEVNYQGISGLGLGLFISAEIIKDHKGKIWVKSQVGKGSTFTFQLPLR